MIKGEAEFPEITSETLKLWNPKIVGPPSRVQWDLKFSNIPKIEQAKARDLVVICKHVRISQPTITAYHKIS